MAYLLMFVTLLHLITLAMLFIATMEKVNITIWGSSVKVDERHPAVLHVFFFAVISVLVGVGRHAEFGPVVQLQV